ncbi:MAG: hypothetical protein HPY64_09490 [Anaerolineae bacterium]|nr:hypothetical protein [Anaerolineae bacterium]
MKKLVVLFVLAMLVLPSSAAIGQGGREETFIYSSSYDMTTLNPILMTDGGSFDVAQFIWAGLFNVDPMTGLPVPGLASWEISEDGLTYTFTIRDDAVWSDGVPITAQDVKFTYDAVASDAVQSPRKSDIESIAAVNVINDKTFEVVLKEVNCTIWNNLAGALNSPLPSHKYAPDFSDIMTSEFNTNPDIASGPYILEEHQADEYTRLRANPNYYLGEPQIPYVIVRVMPDKAVQNQALVAGEIDYAFMYPDELAQLPSLEGLNTFSFPLHNTPILVLNWGDPNDPQPAWDAEGNRIDQPKHPILSDVRVRQAIAMGYDKDAILATLGEGNGVRLISSIIPTITWAFNTELTPWPYDPDRARELLAEAGWADTDGDGILDKDGKPLELELLSSPLTDLWENIALVAQDQLSQLGMKITVTTLEWGAFLNDRLLPQKFDMLVVGFGGGSPPDPNAIANALMYSKNDIPGSGFDIASYVNPEVDDLLVRGRTVPGCSVEDRTPIYWELQRITQQEVAYDFTVTPNQVHVYSARIQNVQPGPWDNGLWNIEKWTISQ